MPRPSELIIEGAKAYAFRLERGWSPAEATRYLIDTKGYTPEMARESASQARRAIKVGEKLAELPLRSKIKEAARGFARPEPMVGVRVLVEIEHTNGRSTFQTVYANVSWDATVEEAIAEAKRIALAGDNRYGPIGSIYTSFVGPTLWSGETIKE